MEAGGWIYEMGDLSGSEASSDDSEDAYSDADESEEGSSGSEKAGGSGSSGADSESVHESEGDYSVYDWSRSDS